MNIVEHYTETTSGDSLSIVKADYIGDFAIRLTFNTGYNKLVDFKPFLQHSGHPQIKKYLDETRFKEFKIVDGNLDWNDFELCFPIEDLYNNSILKERSNNFVY